MFSPRWYPEGKNALRGTHSTRGLISIFGVRGRAKGSSQPRSCRGFYSAVCSRVSAGVGPRLRLIINAANVAFRFKLRANSTQ